MDRGAWWAAVHGVAEGRTWLSDFPFTFHFHALEKEMATHSSVLAWIIPGTGEPGGLPSMGSHRVGHNWSDLAAVLNSGSWWWTGKPGVHGVAELDTTEQLNWAECSILLHLGSFSCGSAGKESSCNTGDLGLIPELGRSTGEGKGYPLQYSGLENSMDCIVLGVAKSQTRLSNFHFS